MSFRNQIAIEYLRRLPC